jgi:hypothetical protein
LGHETSFDPTPDLELDCSLSASNRKRRSLVAIIKQIGTGGPACTDQDESCQVSTTIRDLREHNGHRRGPVCVSDWECGQKEITPGVSQGLQRQRHERRRGRDVQNP